VNASLLLSEGWRDLVRRLRLLWYWVARARLRRDLDYAEAQLGWLGWEQVDFFDEAINAEVEKLREFENTQASLMNTSAELGGLKGDLESSLAAEKQQHDEAQTSFAGKRQPMALELENLEAKRKQKLEAVQRFEAALAEIAQLEKQLEARSLDFMRIEHPTFEIRTSAREVSDELARLSGERKHVLAGKFAAAEEASRLEPAIAQLRKDLERIDSESTARANSFAAAGRRIAGEMRRLEHQRKKSNTTMSRLDREKRKPYRQIGACMADHEIAPLNQPEVLGAVLALRQHEAAMLETISVLKAACAAVQPRHLAIFYLAMAAIIILAAALFLLPHKPVQ